MTAFAALDRAEQLQLSRWGTAAFAQALGELTDDELDGPSLLSGWTRKHLVAHVGYNAAALCRLLDWAATGVQTPMYTSAEQRAAEIDEGATRDAAALRNIFDDTAARLDRGWRALSERAWRAQVRTAQGRLVPATETVWMRAREVWVHGIDLDNGAQFDDVPTVVLESLLADIVGIWRRTGSGDGLVLEVTGVAPIQIGPAVRQVVSGPLGAVVRWATGRGPAGLTNTEPVGEPPRWL